VSEEFSERLRASLRKAKSVGSKAKTRPVGPTIFAKRKGVSTDVGANIDNRHAGRQRSSMASSRRVRTAGDNREVDGLTQVQFIRHPIHGRKSPAPPNHVVKAA